MTKKMGSGVPLLRQKLKGGWSTYLFFDGSPDLPTYFSAGPPPPPPQGQLRKFLSPCSPTAALSAAMPYYGYGGYPYSYALRSGAHRKTGFSSGGPT